MLWSHTAPMRSPPYISWALLGIQMLLVPLVLSGRLQPPLNLTTVSRNFSLFLTWLPAPENPPDVYYRVRYKLVSETNWSPIKHCKHINVTECDLTCDIKDSFANYIVTVRSIFGEFKSLWKESEKISYMFTGSLQPPLNLTTVSRNFSLFLTWLPAPENPPDVYYRVRYKLVSETNWSSIKHCKHINVTECDLTCDIEDSFANYIIKVRSIFGEFKSLWKESEKISYMFTVDPAPPVLNMTRGDNNITIKADLQKPPCFKYLYDLTYRFKIWIKHEKSDEILYNIQMVNTTMTISSVGLKGNLCGAAQTEYNVHKIKYSDFSSPTCQLLAEEYPFWAISFVIVLVVIVLVVVLYFKCRKTSCETKKPDALIFENHKPVLKFSDLSEEMHHKIRMVEKIECPSALISISTAHTDVVKDYPLIGFGYTEKHRLQQQLGAKSGDSLGYTLAHGQSLQSYPNSDNSSSSDVSHGEYLIKSGPTVPFILTLDDIETKRINPETTNNKYNMAKPAEINQLIERQENVPFNTLRIAGANEHIDNSDGESYDKSSSDNEESPKQSSEDLTIYDISENFYFKRQQTDRCTGYEQRGYMAREL